MITVLAAVLLCVAFHLSTEGSIKVTGTPANAVFGMRLGRLSIGVRSYRPGRLYFCAHWQSV